MDSQSIGPVNGSVSGSQSQSQLPSSGASSATSVNSAGRTAQPAEPVAVKSPEPKIEVRSRDPRSLQYQVDGSTRQVVATIVDDNNKTVVVQIPSEEVLRIAKAIDRMKGFLLEGKA
jgi:flagellar protein FlaG